MEAFMKPKHLVFFYSDSTFENPILLKFAELENSEMGHFRITLIDLILGFEQKSHPRHRGLDQCSKWPGIISRKSY